MINQNNPVMDDSTLRWLISSNPWTSYLARTELLDEKLTAPARSRCISDIVAHPLVSGVLDELTAYFPYVAKSHTDAKLTHYKLRMLSDFGLKKQDGLDQLIQSVKERRDGDFFAIRQHLPLKDAGDGGEWNALPCDSPLLTYTLMKLGDHDSLLGRQVDCLKEMWQTEKGWFCHLPFVNGQYKREQIGCPMAGLHALEVFSLNETLKESEFAQNAFKTLARHYESGRSIYYFGRGRRFFTFKYPFVWYNALYVADVLSRFEFAKKHAVMEQLSAWIRDGCMNDGTYKATSVYLEYRDWEFGSKKDASPWITFLCGRILKRLSD
jgi:hypothetical protein